MPGLTQNSARIFPCGWPFLTTGMELVFSWGHSSLLLRPPTVYRCLWVSRLWWVPQWPMVSKPLASPKLQPCHGDQHWLAGTFCYIYCLLYLGSQWSGKRICIWCDNLPVVAIINSKRSKSPRVMDFVRAVTIPTLVHNFTFTAKHIPGLDNSIADSLSRFQMDRFHLLAPNASPTPSTIHHQSTTILVPHWPLIPGGHTVWARIILLVFVLCTV